MIDPQTGIFRIRVERPVDGKETRSIVATLPPPELPRLPLLHRLRDARTRPSYTTTADQIARVRRTAATTARRGPCGVPARSRSRAATRSSRARCTPTTTASLCGDAAEFGRRGPEPERPSSTTAQGRLPTGAAAAGPPAFNGRVGKYGQLNLPVPTSERPRSQTVAATGGLDVQRAGRRSALERQQRDGDVTPADGVDRQTSRLAGTTASSTSRTRPATACARRDRRTVADYAEADRLRQRVRQRLVQRRAARSRPATTSSSTPTGTDTDGLATSSATELRRRSA